MQGMTPEEFSAAAEKGRRMAVESIQNNPEARERIESDPRFGREYARRRYPEAYARRGFLGMFRGSK